MKQLFILFAFLFTANFANAQCVQSVACCKKSTASVASVEQGPKACAAMATVEASSIQKRIDNTTGQVTYYEKSVDAKGVVAWTKITNDEATKKMTKVASAGMEKTPTGEVKTTSAKCCAGGTTKQCADKKAIN